MRSSTPSFVSRGGGRRRRAPSAAPLTYHSRTASVMWRRARRTSIRRPGRAGRRHTRCTRHPCGKRWRHTRCTRHSRIGPLPQEFLLLFFLPALTIFVQLLLRWRPRPGRRATPLTRPTRLILGCGKRGRWRIRRRNRRRSRRRHTWRKRYPLTWRRRRPLLGCPLSPRPK
jgi:hypothetical protein